MEVFRSSPAKVHTDTTQGHVSVCCVTPLFLHAHGRGMYNVYTKQYQLQWSHFACE